MTLSYEKILTGIKTLRRKSSKTTLSSFSFQKLAGDASDRKYTRVAFLDNGQKDSLMLMELSTPSEEKKLPFCNIQQCLNEAGILVPHLYSYDKKRGVLILEDLGDITLQHMLQGTTRETQRAFYKKSIDILLTMHRISKKTSSCIAFSYRFDKKTFMNELNFFLHHLVECYLQRQVENKKEIIECFSILCDQITRQEYCFTHRDYHSRNLMVIDGSRLKVIDFQDARLGPFFYDIASLLYDSYSEIDQTMREELFNYFLEKTGYHPGIVDEYQSVKKDFDYMCIQRTLKAVGTFSFQSVIKKNTRYLRYIPRTLSFAYDKLIHYDELKELRTLVQKLCKETDALISESLP